MFKQHAFLKIFLILVVAVSVAANIMVVSLVVSDSDLCAELRKFKHRIVPPADANLPGGWNKVASDPNNDEELDKQMKKLESLAYLSGSQSAPAGGENVVHYDVGYTWDGYSLYNSAHAPEAMGCGSDSFCTPSTRAKSEPRVKSTSATTKAQK